MFFIKHTELGNDKTALLEIEGPLNSETGTDFEEYIIKLLDNGIIYLVIDSQNINFISSEGIGVVILIQKKISALNGIAVYFNFSHEITMLFRLLGFDKVLNIAADRAEALQIAERKIELGSAPSAGSCATEVKPWKAPETIEKSEPAAAAAAAAARPGAEIEPFVIKCIKCSSLVRVKMKGDHYCPYCSAAFTVSDSGSAVFRISDIPAEEPDKD